MASWCPNCGRNIEEGEKFCRQCGMPQHLEGEEASTWILAPQPTAESTHQTTPVQPGPTSPTAPPTTGGEYFPATPTPIYQPPHPTQYQPPVQEGQSHISLGDWLSGGWQIYRENWPLMSLATLIGGGLSIVTFGILAGPMLMGMFRMAFKTMRGERPEIGDLFNWRGRFLQAFLAFLIFGIVPFGLFKAGGIFLVLSLVVIDPLAAIGLAFVMALILERNVDVASALNEVAHTILRRDAFMWWVAGLVFATISAAGMFGCGVAMLVTVPWMISAAAVAYRDVFGIEDPNRTLH